MIRPGFEPGTTCVLDRCDNQLRHPTLIDKKTSVTLGYDWTQIRDGTSRPSD